MVSASGIVSILYLLAASRGRQKYTQKRVLKQRQPHVDNRRLKSNKGASVPPSYILHSLPDSPRPTYFTCRHTFEDTLIEELRKIDPQMKSYSPFPGCVKVNSISGDIPHPVYALQCLPNCSVVEAPNSINGLARAIVETKGLDESLSQAPPGSLSIHSLVPGMAKGQRDPVSKRRSLLVAKSVKEMLNKRFPAARAQRHQKKIEWLLQILLLSPDVAAVALTRCQDMPSFSPVPWPNPHYPLGMANVDINERMPSSAYRKLLEAFAFLRLAPSPGDIVVDLGAAPGGWTAALVQQFKCRVVAVDRAELDSSLMRHDCVKFIQGDGFSYQPPRPVAWMVSDIVAYPERIVELLESWCDKSLANNMIVTLKFRGDSPDWEALEGAARVGRKHGYMVCAKHFFNNKNEVTLMVLNNNVAASPNKCSFSPLYEVS